MPGSLLRRGQLQITESMLVIILILIIGVFVTVFFAKQASTQYQVKLDEYEDLNVIEVVRLVTSLYELRCSKTGVTEACVDKHKARALKQLWESPDPETKALVDNYYYDIFQDSTITLEQVYPTGEPEMIIYDHHAVEETEGRRDEVIRQVVLPIALYDSTDDSVAFGILKIDRYFKPRVAS